MHLFRTPIIPNLLSVGFGRSGQSDGQTAEYVDGHVLGIVGADAHGIGIGAPIGGDSPFHQRSPSGACARRYQQRTAWPESVGIDSEYVGQDGTATAEVGVIDYLID